MDWSNFKDDIPGESPASAMPVPVDMTVAPAKAFREPCPKCHGTGRYSAPSSLGHHRCLTCNGAGELVFKTSRAQRIKSREQRKATDERKADERLAAYEAEHPNLAEWWTDSDFPFAVSLRQAVRKWGKLTENQLAAAERAAAKLKAARAEAAERKANAVAVDVRPIEEVFATATDNGLRKPILRLAGFAFSPAKPTSNNPGAIYVKQDGTYLGKIMGGRLVRSRECTAEQEAEIVRVAADPKDAAIAYGKLTGCCSVCGRNLENKESVERGIGPVCAEKFGW